MRRTHFGHLASRLLIMGALVPALIGCELLGSTTTEKKETSGGGLKIEDVVAATMALIGTAQLSTVIVSDPGAALDVSAEDYAKKVEAAHDKNACYSLKRNGATLTFDFGATGCKPANGAVAIKGTASCSLAIDKGTKTLTSTTTLANFGGGDKTASGTSTLKVKLADTSADVSIEVKMASGEAAVVGGLNVKMSASQDKKSFASLAFDTIDPTTIAVSGKKGVIVDASAVAFKAGQCYPSGGTIVATYAGVKSTLAFDAATGTSGVAKYTPPLLKSAQDKPLPGLGWKCK